MDHESFPPHEQLEGRFASDREVLGVSRTLLLNTAQYAEYAEVKGPDAHDVIAYDDAAWDLLKHFYELAAPQLTEQALDRRLFPNGDVTQPTEVLVAMEQVLASWQRGGMVTSQQEPLRGFTLWLLDAQRAVVGDIEDDALRHRIERGIDMAEKRLATS